MIIPNQDISAAFDTVNLHPNLLPFYQSMLSMQKPGYYFISKVGNNM